jgi:hypothetical protein
VTLAARHLVLAEVRPIDLRLLGRERAQLEKGFTAPAGRSPSSAIIAILIGHFSGRIAGSRLTGPLAENAEQAEKALASEADHVF